MYSTWLTFPHIMLVCTVTLHKEASSSRSLQRNSRFRFAHFIDHLFHILDVPELESIHVRDRRVCLLYCLRDKRCFSTNLAAKPDINGNYVCELLPTDKYNASDSFKPSQHFNHYSAKVSHTPFYFFISFIYYSDDNDFPLFHDSAIAAVR